MRTLRFPREGKAKHSPVSPMERVARVDKPLATYFLLLCIGPGFSLMYHRITPLASLAATRPAFSSAVHLFRWWTVFLPLPAVPFFVVATYMYMRLQVPSPLHVSPVHAAAGVRVTSRSRCC